MTLPTSGGLSRSRSNRRLVLFGIATAVFIIGLAPRLWRIDAHLTPDELRWVCQTLAFHTGVRDGEPALTLQTGHPGVITMIVGGLRLPVDREAEWSKACFAAASSQYLYELEPSDQDIILQRLYMGRENLAVLSSFLAAVVTAMAGVLFSWRVALVAAPLLALDPLWLANSRFLHLDAVLAGLVSIAVLCLIRYLTGTAERRWLVTSGVAFGLAVIQKSPALFVLGFAPLAWLTTARRRKVTVRTMAGEVTLWLGSAAAAMVAVWPALWLMPLTTTELVLGRSLHHGSRPLHRNSFFAGTVRDDAGALFYPMVWLFRTSPWLTLAMVIALFWVLRQLVTRLRRDRRSAYRDGDAEAVAHGASLDRGARGPHTVRRLALVVGAAAVFTVLLSAGALKFDRYLLPVIPLADVAAAVVLLAAADRGRRWFARRRSRAGGEAADGEAAGGEAAGGEAAGGEAAGGEAAGSDSATASAARVDRRPLTAIVLAAAVTIVQAGLVLPIGPYWVTWFNPLVGGAAAAERVMLVGWGEGLDQAAAFLNEQPHAEDLEVASRYRAAFGLLLRGSNIQTERYDPDTTDFLVVMLNQVQRQQDPHLLAKYFTVEPPAFAAEIGGITLAWVYRNRADEPVMDYLQEHADPARDAIIVREGHILTRRHSGPLPIYEFPDDADESGVAQALTAAFQRHERLWFVHRADDKRKPVDRLMALVLKTGARLDRSENLGDLVADLYADGDLDALARPPEPIPVGLMFEPDGALELVTLGLPEGPWPTDRQAALALSWRITQGIDPPATLSVQLFDEGGEKRAQLDATLVDDSGASTADWSAGANVETRHALDVRDLPPGQYTLSLGVYTVTDDGWQTLAIQDMDIEALHDADRAASVEANRLLVPVRLAGGQADGY